MGSKVRKIVPSDKQPWAFFSSLALFGWAHFWFIHQEQDPWMSWIDMWCSFLRSLRRLPKLRNHSPLQRGPFVWSRLFSLCHGLRQISFVFCLNTEWQSTNIKSKNFGLSFCKSNCIKSVPKIAPFCMYRGSSQGNQVSGVEVKKADAESATIKCIGFHQ